MADFNHFENYIYVTARNFRLLKAKLVEISVPVTLVRMDVRDNGSAYAIVILDRQAKHEHKKKTTSKKTEIVDNSL